MAARESDRIWGELLRLRDRLHELAGAAQGASFSADRANVRLDVLEPKVEAMAEADAIAEGVATKLATKELRSESYWRRWGVRVGIAGAVLAGIGEIVNLSSRIFG